MTGEQIGGIVRTIIAAAGGYAAAKGYGNSELWIAIAGAASTISVAFWSYKSNKPAQ